MPRQFNTKQARPVKKKAAPVKEEKAPPAPAPAPAASNIPDGTEILQLLKDSRPTMFSRYPAWRMDQFSKAFKKGRYTYVKDLRADTKWQSWTKRLNDIPEDVRDALIGMLGGTVPAPATPAKNSYSNRNATKASSGGAALAASQKKPVQTGKCYACDRAIQSDQQSMNAIGASYHTVCFKCIGCQKQLAINAVDKNGDGVIDASEGSYAVKRDLPVCDSKCAKAAFCAFCDQQLKDPKGKIEHDGGFWHPDCLTCAGCEKSVLDPRTKKVNFAVKQDKIVHDEKCAKIIFCGSCDLFIEGKTAVEYDGFSYHAKCFTCTNCDGPLPDQAFAQIAEYPGHRFCQKCAAPFQS